jgi:hypothetical protein
MLESEGGIQALMPYIQAIENATNTNNAQAEAWMAAELQKLSSGGLSMNELEKLGFTEEMIYQYAERRVNATDEEIA